ncbi:MULTISPECIES: metal-dependent transcriptional regulator [unclassified Curtobacterium]|uniref:metal-dependent transcriptional regulator n=1 Tax=unclassified Curtobacterium TaxID=257496 RepID=UPI000F504C19|nr:MULTISPECIES: metal-dependent transcriptional regulator [unclassified Curtobacterium]RPE85200.1 DtxR family iron (metal) dependent repressor [Curtobacterium sp. PhB137]
MRLPSLSTMAEDYVKLIWKAGERGGTGLATRDIAATLKVSASTVSGNLKKLDRDGLIEHTPYYGVVLTPLGQQVAVAMVRRHRLIESFLVSRLGYTWDEVHTEAEALEHAVSERFLDRVDADLGHPTHDPHGDPIPAADGTVPATLGTLLGAIEPGACGTVDRVSDDDPSLLRYFDELGVGLGTHLRVERVRDYAGVIAVSRRGADGAEALVDLPAAAATAIWLAPDAD